MFELIIAKFRIITQKKWFRISYHLGFWVVSLFFFLLFYSNYNRDTRVTIWLTTMLLPLAIVLAYYFNYYLIPRFLYKKKYLRFCFYCFFAILTSLWLSMIVVLVVIILFLSREPDYFDSSLIEPVFQVVGLYFVIFLAIAIKQIKRAFEVQQLNAELELKRMEMGLKLKEAELKLLRSQIHPHFLFNTLNNLYGLTLEKSDLAPKLVLKLSDLMDYMLYRCNKPKVSLTNELENLKNYVEIERIRYNDKIKIDFEIDGKTDQLGIAPMLLLAFFENAFKHGISKSITKSFVDVKIKIEGNKLYLKLANSRTESSSKNEDYTQGIGLKNVKKRLQLIYPDKHRLKINPTTDRFEINLELTLDEVTESTSKNQWTN